MKTFIEFTDKRQKASIEFMVLDDGVLSVSAEDKTNMVDIYFTKEQWYELLDWLMAKRGMIES